MESSDGGAAVLSRAVHYSTGRLTNAQARAVDKWRARLLEDRALPGQPKVSAMMRQLGMDDRPRASCSDVIAAAVRELLENVRPVGLELACYAEASRLAGLEGGASAPVYQPVSFYLPPGLAALAEELRTLGRTDAMDSHEELRREASERFPGDEEQQARWIGRETVRRRLPDRIRQVPRGAIARMAIDRWAGRSADRVAAAAVEYAAEVHDQAHRARRDMRDVHR